MAVLNDGRTSVNVSANKTLALADEGVVQNITVDGLTITLPASAAGLTYVIRNAGAAPNGFAAGAQADGSVGITVTPNGTDTVGGLGFTPAAGKGVQDLIAVAKAGDEICLQAGVSGTWVVEYAKGTWTRTP